MAPCKSLYNSSNSHQMKCKKILTLITPQTNNSKATAVLKVELRNPEPFHDIVEENYKTYLW